MAVNKLGAKALDKYTIQIKLNKPLPYFDQMLAFGTYMPQNEKVAKNMVNNTEHQQIKPYIMVHSNLLIGKLKTKF